MSEENEDVITDANGSDGGKNVNHPKETNSPPKEPTEKKPTAAENLITKADAAALRQEEANKKHEELMNRQEQMIVENKLGGETEAGGEQIKDENAGAKKLLEGTGYETMFDPPKKDVK